MNKLSKIFLALILVVLVAGCGIKSSNDSKVVEDETIIAVLNNHMVNITAIPKTKDLLKEGSFKADSYANDDRLYMGLNGALNSQLAVSYTQAQIKQLKEKGYTATSYIKGDDVENIVKDVFGDVNLKFEAEIAGCPSYKYYQPDKFYLVNENCTNVQDKLVILVDTITNDGNLYYVDSYIALVSNNKVYKDLNKSTEFKSLNNGETFTIDASNKEEFAKYTFKFTKNSDGKYIFTSADKN